jgi:hypothetical protein
VLAAVFEELDRVLGSERGPEGEPSVADFERIELLRIMEVFAERFEELPELIPGRADYRVFISHGMLVPRIVVLGQQASDGTVELVQVDLDLDAGWD